MADAALTITIGSEAREETARPDLEFAVALHQAGMSFQPPPLVRQVAVLGEFVVPLAQVLVPALGGVVIGWLQGRAGRKVRIKAGDTEVEARTIEDVDRLLALVAAHQDRARGEEKT